MPVRFQVRLRDFALFVVAQLLLAVTVFAGPVRAGVLEQAIAVVYTVHSADDEDRFLGSAFLWGQGVGAGRVAVTNAHVVGNATDVRLTDVAGNEQIAHVIASDLTRDVAVLSVKAGEGGLVPSGVLPPLGAEVWALGAPLGVEFTVTMGRISALARQVEPAVPMRMVQHDAAVNPGSSGGPLVDAAGELIGMNSQIADGSRMFVGIAYAISAPDLLRIVQGLIDESLLPFPALGMTARPMDRQLAQAMGISASGLLVDAVQRGALAARTGIQAGDVILAINGQALAKSGDLAFAIESAQTEDRLDVTLLRAGAVVVLVGSFADDQPQHLATRDMGTAQRVASYSIETLGISLKSAEISAVKDNSPALFAGLAEGDVILQVNGQDATPDLLATVSFDHPALFLVQHKGGATRHVLVDPWSSGKTIHAVGGANVLDPDVVVF